MWLFVAKRIGVALPLLLVISLLVFSMSHLTPGGPERAFAGGRPISDETAQAIRDRYNLDDPFVSQYLNWLRGAIRGEFGESISAHVPVADVVGPAIVPTLQLAAYSFALVLLFGIGGGIAAAIARGRAIDLGISGIVLLGSVLSSYLSGLVLITVFSATLGWFPLFGLGDPGLDRLYHLTLPAVAMAIALVAFLARVTRAAMIDVLESDYIEAARSRGFTTWRLIYAHALRNTLVPVLTVSGLAAAYLVAGTVLVEYTFGLNGLGSLLVGAVEQRDFAVVQAVALIFALAFVIANLVVDVLHAVVDPRIRQPSPAR